MESANEQELSIWANNENGVEWEKLGKPNLT